MKRKTVTAGLATVALVGVVGGGMAWASADDATSPTSTWSARHCTGSPMGYGSDAPLTAAADYLRLSRAQLLDRMHSGETLADIARAQGETTGGLKTAMLQALKRSLAADRDLTDAQRTGALARMSRHLDAMIDGTRRGWMDGDDMGGMMGGPGGGMMGGSRGGGSAGFGAGMMDG